MRRVAAFLAWLFPSCNASVENQERLLAAMEGRTYQAPAPGVRGEANPGAGNTSTRNQGATS